jgi:hypothetical protein
MTKYRFAGAGDGCYWKCTEKQVPPLRFAPVGMTKYRFAAQVIAVIGNARKSRSLHSATPDFLLILVASANFMRLSLTKAAHVDVGEFCVAGNPSTLRSG